jgi:hypothetical protein
MTVPRHRAPRPETGREASLPCPGHLPLPLSTSRAETGDRPDLPSSAAGKSPVGEMPTRRPRPSADGGIPAASAESSA